MKAFFVSITSQITLNYLSMLEGVLFLLAGVLGYWIAFRAQLSGQLNRALAFLLLMGLLLRIYGASEFFLHPWDERYHALVAKNFLNHPMIPTLYDRPLLPFEPGHFTNAHIWLSKPPLPLWAMSVSIACFGTGNELLLRLPSILVSVASIWLTYKIASALFDQRVAFMAAFLHSIHGLLIESTAGRVSSDVVDTFFIFFVELAVYSVIISNNKPRQAVWVVLCGVFTGLAFLSKWYPALLVWPLWLGYTIHRRQFSAGPIIGRGILLVMATLVVALPWYIWIRLQFPGEFADLLEGLQQPIRQVVQEHTGPPWYYLDQIRMTFGELIYLPVLWFLVQGIRRPFPKRTLINLWFLIPLVIFSAATTKRPTYQLVFAPALFIISAEFILLLYANRARLKPVFLFQLILVLLIALPVRYSLERLKPFQSKDRKPEWAMALKQLGGTVGANTVLLNYKAPVEAMYYTGMVAYEALPSPDTIRMLQNRGFSIMIQDDGLLPETAAHLSGVRYIRLPAPNW